MAMTSGTREPENNIPDRATLELEHLALENRKLKIELEKALNPNLWDRIGRLSPLLATLLAVVGFLFGVWQYVDQQEAGRKAGQLQEQRELEARDRDFMKPLWEKELELYFRAANVVATIATTRDSSKRGAAEAEFWRLYQGPLVVVENKALSGAMVHFGNCLNGTEKCTSDELVSRSRALASTIQGTIEESARLRLSEFSKNKFQYHR